MAHDETGEKPRWKFFLLYAMTMYFCSAITLTVLRAPLWWILIAAVFSAIAAAVITVLITVLDGDRRATRKQP